MTPTPRSPLRGAPAVRVKDTGYRSYLETSGTRLNGRAAHVGDGKLAAEARASAEPDWSQLNDADLIAAEKMALHRASGGEKQWQRVLGRIRDARASRRDAKLPRP